VTLHSVELPQFRGIPVSEYVVLSLRLFGAVVTWLVTTQDQRDAASGSSHSFGTSASHHYPNSLRLLNGLNAEDDLTPQSGSRELALLSNKSRTVDET
jgi:hypothetical protein